jgi:hypothetical protein
MNKYILLGLGIALAVAIYKNRNKKMNFKPNEDGNDKEKNNPNSASELEMKYSESLANDILPFERAMGNEGRNIVNLQKGLDSDPTFDVDNDVFVGSSIKFRKSSGVVPKRAYKMYDSSINDTISRSRIRLKIRK